MQMTKFNFHGKLYENGKRVLTDTIESINITAIPEGETPTGRIITTGDGDAPRTLALELNLPRGLQGPPGEIPTLSIGNVDTTSFTGDASVTLNPDNSLDFVLPRGPQGTAPRLMMGDVSVGNATSGSASIVWSTDRNAYLLNLVLPKPVKPNIVVDNKIDIVNTEEDARVIDLNSDGNDAQLHFYLPRGEQGPSGPAGKDFFIEQIFDSVEALEEANANNELILGSYYLIHPAEGEKFAENARLYYKEPRRRTSGDTVIEEGALTYLGDFSGANAKIGEVTINNNAEATTSFDVETSIPEFDVEQNAWITDFKFTIPRGYESKTTVRQTNTKNSHTVDSTTGEEVLSEVEVIPNYLEPIDGVNETQLTFNIPRGASSKITDVTVNEATSQDAASVSSNTEYNEDDDSYDTSLEFTIPKGRSSKILTPTINTEATSKSEIELVTSENYNEVTDTYDTSLEFTIPKGASSRITDVTIDDTATSQSSIGVSSSTEYNETTDTNDTSLEFTIPKGASAIVEPHIEFLDPNTPASWEAGAIRYENEYQDSEGNVIKDVYVTPFTARIPRGAVPHLDTGTVQSVYTEEEFDVNITYEDGNPSEPRLNLSLPIGRTPILSAYADPVDAQQNPSVTVEYPTVEGKEDTEHPTLHFEIPSGKDGKDAEFAGIEEVGAENPVVKQIGRGEQGQLVVAKSYITDSDIDADSFGKTQDIQDAIYAAIEDIITISPDEPTSDYAKIWIKT